MPRPKGVSRKEWNKSHWVKEQKFKKQQEIKKNKKKEQNFFITEEVERTVIHQAIAFLIDDVKTLKRKIIWLSILIILLCLSVILLSYKILYLM